MDALCPGPLKYLFLPEDTCLDRPLQYRVLACSVRASPMADRFDRTTSRASNLSLARSTIDIPRKPRLEIAEPVRRLSFRVGLESDGDPRTICNWDQAPALPLSLH